MGLDFQRGRPGPGTLLFFSTEFSLAFVLAAIQIQIPSTQSTKIPIILLAAGHRERVKHTIQIIGTFARAVGPRKHQTLFCRRLKPKDAVLNSTFSWYTLLRYTNIEKWKRRVRHPEMYNKRRFGLQRSVIDGFDELKFVQYGN
jgi:hypothetical protein